VSCVNLYNHKLRGHSPDHVPHEEEEGVSGRRAEVLAINRVSVEELDKLLQAPEAALQAAQQELCKLILGDCGQQLVVQILQQNPDDLNDGEDEGAERQSSRVIPERHILSSKPSPQGRKQWAGGHVIWLDKGPVVGGKGPGQGHLSQSRDEVGTPEEEEDVVELQADQVLVVKSLSPVEGKKALGVRALLFHITAGVVLGTDTGYKEGLEIV
uniref:Uncharacterized protein n=1 Tax=Monopterus albus TaxID=43700 RepID=A0A3Q3Q1Q6_MONAL